MNCKHTNFWALSLILWRHNHLIENGHLLCIWRNFRSRLCTSTAAYHIMWICNVPSAVPSDFPLTRPVSSPCHIFFAIALPPVLLWLLPAMQVCPFVATSVAKGFCSQPNFCHWISSPCFYPRHVFARVFCHRCCHYLCPRRFFPSMLPCKLPPPLPLPLLLPSRLPWLLPSNLGA